MAERIALCIDEAMLHDLESIGLEGERLGSQSWLDVYTEGLEARTQISVNEEISEAWVIACGDVEPINLAATLKADRPDLHVCLIALELCGSLLSRAHNALIDEVLEVSSFTRRYSDAKQKFADASLIAQHARLEPAVDLAAPTADPPVRSGDEVQVADQAPIASLASNIAVGSAAASQTGIQPNSQPIVAHTKSRAFVLSVVSGSGGAGKSSVSALSALIARNCGHKTLLLDYDLQFGDVAGMLGFESPLCVDEAIMHPESLERELLRNEPLMVLAAPLRLEAAESVASHVPGLLERLSGEFDVIVANTGAAWAEYHAALLERSSVALFLVDQRASSVRACKHALDLCARCSIAATPFQFALNRCGKGAPLSSVDVSAALQGAPVFELRDGGRDVEDYLSSGSAADLLDLKNEFAKSLEHVLSRLLPNGLIEAHVHAPHEAPRRSLLSWDRRADRKHGRK